MSISTEILRDLEFIFYDISSNTTADTINGAAAPNHLNGPTANESWRG